MKLYQVGGREITVFRKPLVWVRVRIQANSDVGRISVIRWNIFAEMNIGLGTLPPSLDMEKKQVSPRPRDALLQAQ
jgi:hypothetical protein